MWGRLYMVGGDGILKHTCYATPHLTYRQTVPPFAEAPPGSCRCELILSHPTSTAPVFFRDTLSRGIRRDVRGGGSLSWLWSPGPGRIVGSFLTIGETTVASCIGMCASVVLSRTEGGLVPFYPQARFWSPHHPLGSGEDTMLHSIRVYRLLSEVQFWLLIRDRGTLWMSSLPPVGAASGLGYFPRASSGPTCCAH